MKRFLIVLLFLLIPFSIPTSILAEDSTSTISATPNYTCHFQVYKNQNIFTMDTFHGGTYSWVYVE